MLPILKLAMGAPIYPATLGVVRDGWRMQALCVDCDGTDKFEIDIAAAVIARGKDCPLRSSMLQQRCRCGTNLTLYFWSPIELAALKTKCWRG
jgi:hypothetical protein